MSYYRFSEDDVFYNRLKTHPSCQFFVFKGCTYYNNQYTLSGALNDIVGHASSSLTSSCHSGFVNLYEMNVDRPERLHSYEINKGSGVETLIYPLITKDGTRNALRNISYGSYVEDFSLGDTMTGSYPLTASVKRIIYEEESSE